MRSLLFALLVASCAPRAMTVGPDHPANPDAEAGRLAGPPTALRADLQTSPPAEPTPPQSHEGHTMPAGGEPKNAPAETQPASDAKPAGQPASDAKHTGEPATPAKPKAAKPKSPAKPKTPAKPKSPAPTGHEGHNMDDMKPKQPAPSAPSDHEGHH